MGCLRLANFGPKVFALALESVSPPPESSHSLEMSPRLFAALLLCIFLEDQKL